MRTLYVTGWCVSRKGKEIRAMRARIGRQRFAGNYGIERKDVGAALERIGFAIAVPLRRGKSQVIVEVQEADGVWRAISTRFVFGTSDAVSAAPIDARVPLFPIPAPIHGLNSGSIVPWSWPRKFVISGLRLVPRDFRRRNY